MSISFKVLGDPFKDNSLYLSVNSSKSSHNMLFDCGENCLEGLKISKIKSISDVFFSHFHMDHMLGFGSFFRHTYNTPYFIRIWGPKDASKVMSNYFSSFTWNLYKSGKSVWKVYNIDEKIVREVKFKPSKSFKKSSLIPKKNKNRENIILDCDNFKIQTINLPHGNIDSIGYKIIEKDKSKICNNKLKESRLKPGPWITNLLDKNHHKHDEIIIDNKKLNLNKLYKDLVMIEPGDSIAYLTDYHIIERSRKWHELIKWLKGVKTVISECQYKSDEIGINLSKKNSHMNTNLLGKLALDSKIHELIIFHCSRRYKINDLAVMLQEIRTIFPNSKLPNSWNHKANY